ncbi:hypothetical protein [Bradyrhizobium sp. RDI18]|uniref:hypothetical protein n=1 Tax=Bradyrhizobium sp. RDI18 TaxID=3367400 RepID=UPI00371729FF
MHIGVGTGCPQRHRFNNFDNVRAVLPCAAGRSNARKALEKIEVQLLRPTSRWSSAMRAFA